DADVFAFDLILVVQSGAGNAAAAYGHRLKDSDRSKNSGATDLNPDVEQTLFDPFRLIFVSNGPARRLGREPKPGPLRIRVDFHDGAVGLIRKITAHSIKLADRVQNLLDRIGHPPACRRGQ